MHNNTLLLGDIFVNHYNAGILRYMCDVKIQLMQPLNVHVAYTIHCDWVVILSIKSAPASGRFKRVFSNSRFICKKL